jgi:membrane protease YdiL (CAAX protease family)
MQAIHFLAKTPTGKWAIIFIAFGFGISLSYAALLLFGYSTADLSSIFNSPTASNGLALGWANAFQQLGMFGFSWLLLQNQFELPNKKITSSFSWSIALCIGLAWLVLSYGLIEFLGTINQMILGLSPEIANWAHSKELSSLKIQSALLSNDQGWGLFQVVFLVAVVPGILEELFFRSVLLRWKLSLMKPVWAIALNGFIFSFIHFQFEGFLARWLLGIMLAWVYWKSGKIWMSIALHVFNNALSIFLYMFVYQEMSFNKEHWIHHPLSILGSILFFIAGWKAIDYLWRPKGISA